MKIRSSRLSALVAGSVYVLCADAGGPPRAARRHARPALRRCHRRPGEHLAADVYGTDSLRDDQTGGRQLFARADMRLRIRPLPIEGA